MPGKKEVKVAKPVWVATRFLRPDTTFTGFTTFFVASFEKCRNLRQS
jgi:hypothetical protein